MAEKIVVWDDIAARYKASTSTLATISGGGFTTENFDVPGGGQATFSLAYDIVSTDDIKVYVNGMCQREGGSHDYTLNYSTNQVIFNYTVPEDAWVRVDIFGTSSGAGASRAGTEAVSSGVTSKVVTFSGPMNSANYAIIAQLSNVVDGSPQYQVVEVTNKTASGFTATWPAATDSANYKLEYIAALHS